MKTCPNKNPAAISGEHNFKRSYPSVNALYCLENLYAAILPSASQVNTQTDFATILKSRARLRGRVSTNETTDTKKCVHKFACTDERHAQQKENVEGKT